MKCTAYRKDYVQQTIINKPWGRERILEHNDRYVLKIIEVDPGQRLSLQYHERKCETMYCLYGYGQLILINKNRERKMDMLPGRYYTIYPNEIHRLVASETSPLAVLEVSTPELEDVVRIEDDYNR